MSRPVSSAVIALLTACLSVASMPSSLAMAVTSGDGLDPGFGNAGKVVTGVPPGGGFARAVVIQSDARIVAGGSNGGQDFALIRMNADGSPDPTFGSAGQVITDISGPGEQDLGAIATQADGKIVAAGGTAPAGFCCRWALARYATNGSLDATFDGDGKLLTDIAGGATGVAIQQDGKIVAVGGGMVMGGGFTVARFDSDGTLDATFGSAGIAKISFGSDVDSPSGVAIQSDGKIVVVGGGGAGLDFLLARFTTTGSLDASFGINGRVVTDMGGNDRANAVAIQQDGKIVVAGDGAERFTVARYLPNGTLDSSFDGDGKVATPFYGENIEEANAVSIQSDGKIVAVGRAFHSYDSKFAVARYDTDGWLDGKTTTDFGNPADVGVLCPSTRPDCSEDIAYGVAIQADGKIVAAGGGGACTPACEWTLARYSTIPPIQSLSASPVPLGLGYVAIGTSVTRTVTVTNTGSVDATVSSVALTAVSGSGLSIGSQGCSIGPLAPRASCQIGVRFAPTAGGPVSARLQVQSDVPSSPLLDAVSGRGVLANDRISGGWYHSCLLGPAGALSCWGDPADGATVVPAGTYKMVSAGWAFTCAIRSDSTVGCWGYDGNGEASPPSGTFTTVSAGGSHACGVRANGALACWGDNTYGQASPPSGTFQDVASGYRHACATRTDGTLACWGSGSDGQTTPPTGTFVEVAAGAFNSCALRTSGALACWGYNGDGESAAPAGTFVGLSTGQFHSCAAHPDGTLACWGENSDGQASPPAGSFVGLGAGGWHTCALRSDWTPVCWGSNYYDQTTTSAPPATTFVPVAPTRLLDSRSGIGLSGSFKAGVARTFQVAGRGTIPSNAVAVTGNLTVTRQTAPGFGALTPVATNSPATSTLNFPVGDNRANNVTAPLGPGGSVALVYKSTAGQTTDFVFDVTGYFVATTSGATYMPVEPVRLLDTRYGNGLSGTFVSGTARTWTVAGRGGIPVGATAITANVTVTGQTGAGYVTILPSPTGTPSTSTINFPVGDNRANGVTVKLGTNGTLSAVYKATAGARTNLILDVTGYYVAGLGGARFYPLKPDRILDTRYQIGFDTKLSANAAQTLEVAGHVGVPLGGRAVTGNLTVVGQTKAGYVSMTRTTTNTPSTSTLNFPVGDIRANGVTGTLSSNGTVGLVYRASAPATTNLVLDITGYFK